MTGTRSVSLNTKKFEGSTARGACQVLFRRASRSVSPCCCCKTANAARRGPEQRASNSARRASNCEAFRRTVKRFVLLRKPKATGDEPRATRVEQPNRERRATWRRFVPPFPDSTIILLFQRSHTAKRLHTGLKHCAPLLFPTRTVPNRKKRIMMESGNGGTQQPHGFQPLPSAFAPPRV